MTSSATVIVDGRKFRVDTDLDVLKSEIREAVRSGGDWVRLTTVGGHRNDVLVTALSQIRIELARPDDEDDADDEELGAGSTSVSAFFVESFDEYGL